MKESRPHADLCDIAPLGEALGVLGVDDAVFPHGGRGGEGGGVGVVGAGVHGEELPAGAGVLLDLDGFHAVLDPGDPDLAADKPRELLVGAVCSWNGSTLRVHPRLLPTQSIRCAKGKGVFRYNSELCWGFRDILAYLIKYVTELSDESCRRFHEQSVSK